MRRTLPIALAASLTLGAAAPQDSPVAECRLPYNAALAALRRLSVQHRETVPSEHGYRHIRKFDTAGLAAFGFPVRAMNAIKVDAIGHESLVLTITLNAPYAAVRDAALASRGRRTCASTEGPPGYCEIDKREQGGWTNSFLLLDEDPTLSCLYARSTP
jgi:hypothetical protein